MNHSKKEEQRRGGRDRCGTHAVFGLLLSVGACSPAPRVEAPIGRGSLSESSAPVLHPRLNACRDTLDRCLSALEAQRETLNVLLERSGIGTEQAELEISETEPLDADHRAAIRAFFEALGPTIRCVASEFKELGILTKRSAALVRKVTSKEDSATEVLRIDVLSDTARVELTIARKCLETILRHLDGAKLLRPDQQRRALVQMRRGLTCVPQLRSSASAACGSLSELLAMAEKEAQVGTRP